MDAQNIRVVSENDQQPIPSAHIQIKNLATGIETMTLTDYNGNATLTRSGSTNDPYRIKITSLGFQTLEDTIMFIRDFVFALKEENTTLNDIVITAQYAPSSTEKAVHKIRVIDRKKIDAMAAVNLRDVLTNELNIRISQDNILGSSMSLQGISGQNVKILIDGVPVNGRLNGNIDLSQINLNNTERIEIIEGPLSVNFGTDALGGTINIITKKTQKERYSFSSGNYYESSGHYNFNGRIGIHKGKNILSFSGGRNFFDGWSAREKTFEFEHIRPADQQRHKEWKPKEQYFGTIYYGHYFNRLKFGYTGDYFHELITNRGLPRLPYRETAFDDYYTTQRIGNSVSLGGELRKNLYINQLIAHNHFKRIKNTYYTDLTDMSRILSINDDDQDTSTFSNITIRGTISQSTETSKISFEAGYDLNHETATGVRIKNKKQQIGDYALFVSAELKPHRSLIVRPGLRLIYNDTYRAPVIPSLNVKYSIKSNKTSTMALRFTYARGFRSPSLKELYFYFVDINHKITGNSELKAEQSNNFNLTASLNKVKKDRVIKSELSIFYNEIKHMISLAQSATTEYSYFNVDLFKSTGIQFQHELAIDHLKVNFGGAFIGRQSTFLDFTPTDNFLFAPEGRCNLFYEWYRQNITIGLFYKYTGKLPTFISTADDVLQKSIISDYHTADLSLSKSISNKKINITIGAKNLFDVTNIVGVATGAAHSSGGNNIAVGVGRTYFLKVDLNLNSNN